MVNSDQSALLDLVVFQVHIHHFVIATTTAIYLKNGVTDLFILSLVFSIVVMYDASGVRLEAWTTSSNT